MPSFGLPLGNPTGGLLPTLTKPLGSCFRLLKYAACGHTSCCLIDKQPWHKTWHVLFLQSSYKCHHSRFLLACITQLVVAVSAS